MYGNVNESNLYLWLLFDIDFMLQIQFFNFQIKHFTNLIWSSKSIIKTVIGNEWNTYIMHVFINDYYDKCFNNTFWWSNLICKSLNVEFGV